MKKIALLLGLTFGTFAFAQSSNLALLNGHLSSSQFISHLKASKAKLNAVSKTNFEGMEIQKYTAKNVSYDAISLAKLNIQNGLSADQPVMVNGKKITDTSILVVMDGFNVLKTEMIDGQKVVILAIENK